MRNPTLDAIVDDFTKQLIAEGRLVEAGFRSLIVTAYPGHAIMPPDQNRMLREAFFAGAQHLLGSIMSTLDAGDDASEADMKRMSQIAAELDKFVAEYAQKHIKTAGSAS